MALFSGRCGRAARRRTVAAYHLYYCMTPLLSRLRDHLARRRLFAAGGTAVVAVSGGPDSVALLDLVHSLAPELGLALVVAHADHGIQADSSSVGQAVAALARRYGLPFDLGELHLGPDATETAARRARYAWLADVQRRRAARYLVTAHHRDDQVETILLRLLRGSAPAGLAGMPARARGGLVRPLLAFTHLDLVEHVTARGLPVHDDPANRDPGTCGAGSARCCCRSCPRGWARARAPIWHVPAAPPRSSAAPGTACSATCRSLDCGSTSMVSTLLVGGWRAMITHWPWPCCERRRGVRGWS